MTDSNSSLPLDGIAVVGIAGRFPGSGSCDEFWQNLRAGREGLTFFTDEEIEATGCDLGSNKGKRVRSRGVVDEADMFDAAFFGYTPREAEIMDPQQRVFLEVAGTRSKVRASIRIAFPAPLESMRAPVSTPTIRIMSRRDPMCSDRSVCFLPLR